jgi:hypothetical protein
MAAYENNVAFVPNAEGVYSLKQVRGGNWNAENIAEGVEALVKANVKVSQYAFWVNKPDFPRLAKPVAAKEITALLEDAVGIELVAARRRTKAGRVFYVPVIRIDYDVSNTGDGSATPATVNGHPVL